MVAGPENIIKSLLCDNNQISVMIMIIKDLPSDDDDEIMTVNLKGLSETFKAHFLGKMTH